MGRFARSMAQTRKPFAATTVTPPAVSGLQLGIHHATNKATYPFPQTTAQKTILHDAVHHQIVNSGNAGMILGANTSDTSATPFASLGGLSNLDAMVSTCAASNMKRTGGKLWLQIYPCPWWMSGATNYTQAQSLPVLTANNAAFAQFCADLANRYGPIGTGPYNGMIDGVIPWNEHKGYGAFSTLGRWDYVAYTNLLNLCYDAVHAVQPGLYFGAPYMAGRPCRSNNGAATQGVSKLTDASLEPSGVSSFVGEDNVAGIYGWYKDAKSLDLGNYYIQNAVGKYTHFVADGRTWVETNTGYDPQANTLMLPPSGVTYPTTGSIVLGSGSRVIDDVNNMKLTVQWLKARLPSTAKVLWSETYWGDCANEGANAPILFNKVLAGAKTSGLDIMCGWMEANLNLSDPLFTTGGVITPTGTAYQTHTATLP